MQELVIISERILNNLNIRRERYLLAQIDWSQRLMGIKGARGSGKTTLLLQRIKSIFPNWSIENHSLIPFWYALLKIGNSESKYQIPKKRNQFNGRGSCWDSI